MNLFDFDEEEYIAFCGQQKKCCEDGDLFYVDIPNHPHLIAAICGRYKTNCAINTCRDNNMLTVK